MTAPTHVTGNAELAAAIGGASLTAPIGGASLSAVQLLPTYPSANLYPSETTFPGHTYVTVGLCAAVLAAQPLAESAIQHI